MTDNRQTVFKTILTALAIGCVGFFGMSWLLGPVFSGEMVLPQSFGIAGIKIQIYGLIIAVAAAAGYWLAVKRRDKLSISSEDADLIIFFVIIAGFIGPGCIMLFLNTVFMSSTRCKLLQCGMGD